MSKINFILDDQEVTPVKNIKLSFRQETDGVTVTAENKGRGTCVAYVVKFCDDGSLFLYGGVNMPLEEEIFNTEKVTGKGRIAVKYD